MGNATESTLPHGNTSGYDRKACRTCACSTCYEQEFCDRCSSCQNQSRKLDRCNAYEGAYLYFFIKNSYYIISISNVFL